MSFIPYFKESDRKRYVELRKKVKSLANLNTASVTYWLDGRDLIKHLLTIEPKWASELSKYASEYNECLKKCDPWLIDPSMMEELSRLHNVQNIRENFFHGYVDFKNERKIDEKEADKVLQNINKIYMNDRHVIESIQHKLYTTSKECNEECGKKFIEKLTEDVKTFMERKFSEMTAEWEKLKAKGFNFEVEGYTPNYTAFDLENPPLRLPSSLVKPQSSDFLKSGVIAFSGDEFRGLRPRPPILQTVPLANDDFYGEVLKSPAFKAGDEYKGGSRRRRSKRRKRSSKKRRRSRKRTGRR